MRVDQGGYPFLMFALMLRVQEENELDNLEYRDDWKENDYLETVDVDRAF